MLSTGLTIIAVISAGLSGIVIGSIIIGHGDDAVEDVGHDFADDPRPATLLVQSPFFHREGL